MKIVLASHCKVVSITRTDNESGMALIEYDDVLSDSKTYDNLPCLLFTKSEAFTPNDDPQDYCVYGIHFTEFFTKMVVLPKWELMLDYGKWANDQLNQGSDYVKESEPND